MNSVKCNGQRIMKIRCVLFLVKYATNIRPDDINLKNEDFSSIVSKTYEMNKTDLWLFMTL